MTFDAKEIGAVPCGDSRDLGWIPVLGTSVPGFLIPCLRHCSEYDDIADGCAQNVDNTMMIHGDMVVTAKDIFRGRGDRVMWSFLFSSFNRKHCTDVSRTHAGGKVHFVRRRASLES